MSYSICLLKIIKINPSIKNIFELDQELMNDNLNNKTILMNEMNSLIFAHKKNKKINRFKSISIINKLVWYSLKIDNSCIILILFKNFSSKINIKEINHDISEFFNTQIEIENYDKNILFNSLKKIFKKHSIWLPLDLKIITEKNESIDDNKKKIIVVQKNYNIKFVFILTTGVLIFWIFLLFWTFQMIKKSN